MGWTARLYRLSLWIAPMALAATTASAAPPSLDPGAPLIEEGQALYARGELAKSKKVLLRAKELTREPRLLGRAPLYLGRCALVEGDQRQAEGEFRRALQLDASLDLDPQRFKPELVEVFRRVRQELLATRGGSQGQPPSPAPSHGPRVEGSLAGDRELGKEPAARQSPRIEISLAGERELGAGPTQRREDKGGSSSPGGRRRWTWALAGATVVSLAVAVGLGVAASSSHSEGCAIVDPEGQRDCRPDPAHPLSAADTARYDDLRQSVDRQCLGTNIALAVTGALAIATAAVFWIEGRPAPAASRHERRQSRLRVWSPPSHQAGAGLGVSF